MSTTDDEDDDAVRFLALSRIFAPPGGTPPGSPPGASPLEVPELSPERSEDLSGVALQLDFSEEGTFDGSHINSPAEAASFSPRVPTPPPPKPIVFTADSSDSSDSEAEALAHKGRVAAIAGQVAAAEVIARERRADVAEHSWEKTESKASA